MTNRLCFVQFIHPGGEHWPDEPGLKHWNEGPHQRKFIQARGKIVNDAGIAQEDELIFWGEWEPPSRVVSRFDAPVLDGPRFLHEPLLTIPDDDRWRQNTDPFVFGDQFHYTGCLQHTKRGPTQLRSLARGSVLMFGSCRELSRFVVDTVFVVDHWIDHSKADYREKLDGAISDTYEEATIRPWYRGNVPESRSHRLYVGATLNEPVEGMFSFFPCTSRRRHPDGFARPEIRLPRLVTPHLTQGKRLNPQTSIEDAIPLWEQVVDQVRGQGLDLGIYAEPPSPEPAASRTHH